MDKVMRVTLNIYSLERRIILWEEKKQFVRSKNAANNTVMKAEIIILLQQTHHLGLIICLALTLCYYWCPLVSSWLMAMCAANTEAMTEPWCLCFRLCVMWRRDIIALCHQTAAASSPVLDSYISSQCHVGFIRSCEFWAIYFKMCIIANTKASNTKNKVILQLRSHSEAVMNS